MELPTWPGIKQNLDKDLTKDNLDIKWAKSIVLLGGPLEGYTSLTEGCDGMNCTQTNEMKEFLKPLRDKFMKE